MKTEGPGIDTISIPSMLQDLGDFSTISDWEAGKIASRLQLMVSKVAWTQSKRYPLMFEIKSSEIETFDDPSNDGCGFIPQSFLDRFGLGKATKFRQVCTIQVRIFAPSLGWFKGLLTLTPASRSKIRVPLSMRKVERSKTNTHDRSAIIAITAVFPSEQCNMLGRLLHPDRPTPSPKCLSSLKSLCTMFVNLLQMHGLPQKSIDMYIRQCEIEPESRSHASLLGIPDATRQLPKGCIFMTGVGTTSSPPSGKEVGSFKVLVTRYPCTEIPDLVVLNHVSSKPLNMHPDNWTFLQSLPFGFFVFGEAIEGEPLPKCVNNGDLDGDLYVVLWVSSLIRGRGLPNGWHF